jgi:hypothetical protein
MLEYIILFEFKNSAPIAKANPISGLDGAKISYKSLPASAIWREAALRAELTLFRFPPILAVARRYQACDFDH